MKNLEILPAVIEQSLPETKFTFEDKMRAVESLRLRVQAVTHNRGSIGRFNPDLPYTKYAKETNQIVPKAKTQK